MTEIIKSSESPAFPAGVKDAWRFSVFNALSFQIVLGSPMILYAKTLNANATVLGIIAGMMPLMVIFQIPAAQYINRIGYKRFVLAGWGSRTLFTFGMALVPLATGYLDITTRLVLLLALLFGFNLVRGISSCAWLPWIAHLVPENHRGRYVSGDTAMANLGSFLTVIVSAFCLGEAPHAWQFAVIFVFSAVMGGISLMYLNRVPDVPITEEIRSSNQPVPWLELLKYEPFQKLLRYVILWALAYGGFVTFSVAFLKTETGMTEAKILFVTSVAFLGGLSSLWLLGHRLDHVGSKPILGLSLGFWLAIVLGWIAVAGGLLHPYLGVILALQFLMGLFYALVSMANSRLAMAIIPAVGRNHFFVLYSVGINVALGIAPILWGLLIDLIGDRQFIFLGLNWNHYTIFYSLAFVMFISALWMSRKLHEPKAASLETLITVILIESPQRFWLRIWSRD
ncbi:MAG TPA: MFS transporter [Verrucomicrobiae bacterium]|nr:MFS transporter [Verrucomicrobiae bacterium]